MAPRQVGCEVPQKQMLEQTAQCDWGSVTSTSGHGAMQILDVD